MHTDAHPPAELTTAQAVLEPQADLGRLQRLALLVGGVAAVGTVAGFFVARPDFYRALHTAWLFWLQLAVGLLALGMLNHVSGGRWGVTMRRVFEAAGRTIPFFAVVAIPVMLDLPALFPWADADHVAHDVLLQNKAVYLNAPFFYARGALYPVVWTALAFVLSRLSHRHDATGDPRLRVTMQRVSAVGLVFFALSGTFASVDWVMSLEPHWFSSLFGFSFASASALSGFSFSAVMLVYLSRRKPFLGLVKPARFHDYGKLMLAFTMFWGYMTVSQYLIIWSGNLPEEVPWYLVRNSNGWQAITVLLVVGHFFLPFLILLSADVKRKPHRLLWVACWLLLMRWFDLFWQVTPSVQHWQAGQGLIDSHHASFHWLDPVAVLAVGGLWMAVFVGQLKNRALLPVQDPTLQEVIAHG